MASAARISLFTLLFLYTLTTTAIANKQTYIVHIKPNSKPQSFATHQDWYSSSLAADDSLLYTYDAAFHGFAASLDPDQADALRNSDYVVDVYEETVYTLHTTRTPQFLGLNNDFGLFDGNHRPLDVDQASFDVVVGVLDTGVWLLK